MVGYLLAAVASEWHLTYGRSATILYSGGVGAIVGAVVFGAFPDAWGRKPQMVIGTLICALSSGLIAFIPEGSWLLFAILHFFVGVGLTAAQMAEPRNIGGEAPAGLRNSVAMVSRHSRIYS